MKLGKRFEQQKILSLETVVWTSCKGNNYDIAFGVSCKIAASSVDFVYGDTVGSHPKEISFRTDDDQQGEQCANETSAETISDRYSGFSQSKIRAKRDADGLQSDGLTRVIAFRISEDSEQPSSKITYDRTTEAKQRHEQKCHRAG